MNNQNEVNVPDTEKTRVVVIGGGFGGIELAKALNTRRIQLVMLDRYNYHTFQPLLYQVATAGLEPDSIAGPLRKAIGPRRDFYFRLALVKKIDTENKCLHTSIGSINYDILVIANGSKTNYFGNESIAMNCFPLKQIPHALDLRSHILQNFERAVVSKNREEKIRLLNFVIVGGGPTGVELAGALGELKKDVLPKDYPDLDLSLMKINLVEGTDRLLPAMTPFAGEKAYKYLQKFGVDIYLNTLVKSYDGELAQLSDGRKMETSTLIWAAGVMGNVIDGLPEEVIEKNRILVDEYNRVLGFDHIFAIGDVALMKTRQYQNGLPMLAPVAMQQGRRLAKNLSRLVDGKPLVPFEYLDKGAMATVGRNRAVVNLPGNLNFGGFFAWFIWLFVHLLYIVGFRGKIVVLANWIWNYFTYDRGTRLIIRPFVKGKNMRAKGGGNVHELPRPEEFALNDGSVREKRANA